MKVLKKGFLFYHFFTFFVAFLVQCESYVCGWGAWSSYSTTCGKSMLRKRYPTERKETSQHIGKCPASLNLTPCSKTPQDQIRSAKCEFYF